MRPCLHQSFGASVTLGTSTFYSNNSYDPNQILNNQYQSNITYTKNWQGTPFGLTVSALHSQNTGTKQINVTLPAINFHVAQINPFQRKKVLAVTGTIKSLPVIQWMYSTGRRFMIAR